MLDGSFSLLLFVDVVSSWPNNFVKRLRIEWLARSSSHVCVSPGQLQFQWYMYIYSTVCSADLERCVWCCSDCPPADWIYCGADSTRDTSSLLWHPLQAQGEENRTLELTPDMLRLLTDFNCVGIACNPKCWSFSCVYHIMKSCIIKRSKLSLAVQSQITIVCGLSQKETRRVIFCALAYTASFILNPSFYVIV